MDFNEFEKIIDTSLKGLPDKFSDILKEKQIQIIPREKMPEVLRKQNRGSVVFGVFIGVPYGRFVNMQTEPTRIELYKESFEEVYTNQQEIKLQIRKTVVHEIAHYFGFSEKEIRESGY